jgi:HB1, ASXL, restriction endonuclease HTH domain
MSSSKNIDLATLRIGTRVRHSADGALGRIVWANAVAVKIQWDDGEKVTWKRADLGIKGLEIVEADDSSQSQGEDDRRIPEGAGPAAQTVAIETGSTEAPQEGVAAVSGEPDVAETDVGTLATTRAPESRGDGPVEPTTEPSAAAATDPETEGAAATDAAAPAKTKRAKRPQSTQPKPARTSALDAAAKVLAEAGRPMTCQEMITAMAEKGYWTSPGGKTPAATLYSAILREVQTKAGISRLIKTERGKFARTSAV